MPEIYKGQLSLHTISPHSLQSRFVPLRLSRTEFKPDVTWTDANIFGSVSATLLRNHCVRCHCVTMFWACVRIYIWTINANIYAYTVRTESSWCTTEILHIGSLRYKERSTHIVFNETGSICHITMTLARELRIGKGTICTAAAQ